MEPIDINLEEEILRQKTLSNEFIKKILKVKKTLFFKILNSL
jgi:hypothetical protein